MWVAPVTIMVATLLSYIDRQTLAVLSPTILQDTGLSAGDYADALMAFQIFYMFGNPLWGSVMSRPQFGCEHRIPAWAISPGKRLSVSRSWAAVVSGETPSRNVRR